MAPTVKDMYDDIVWSDDDAPDVVRIPEPGDVIGMKVVRRPRSTDVKAHIEAWINNSMANGVFDLNKLRQISEEL